MSQGKGKEGEVSFDQAMYQLSKPEFVFDSERVFQEDVNTSPKYRKNESKWSSISINMR